MTPLLGSSRSVAFAAALSAFAGAHAAESCSARSGATAPIVVELYTSEGCNSCPPADRWLSSLKDRADVLPLAFHVDYWDRLGWKDRFASAAYTERQQQLQRASGARFIYTPQVVVDGRDWRSWPKALPPAAASSVELELRRDGSRIEALVRPGRASPSRLAAYWAFVEDGHVSEVRAGENAGATLQHDAVVRVYSPVPAWSGHEPQRLAFEPPAAERRGRVVLVVVDAATLRPVGALRLDC